MGIYLSTPCSDVDVEEGEGNGVKYAVAEMQVGLVKLSFRKAGVINVDIHRDGERIWKMLTLPLRI